MKNIMSKISEFELNRQLFHIFLGVLLALLLRYGQTDKEMILIITLTGLLLSYTIKKTKIRIPIIHQLLQKFERKKELENFPGKGIIFYLIGVSISLFLFPKEIAMASIMVLAFGDSVSHLYGLHFGRIKHPLSKTKFLEGTIAGFVAGFIGALFFLGPFEAFFASLAAMLVEAIEIRIGTEQIDDNLVVPFAAGAIVWIIRLF